MSDAKPHPHIRLLRAIRALRERIFDRPGPILIWIIGTLIGVAVGYAVVAFRLAIDFFSIIGFGAAETRLASAAAELPAWRVMITPILGGVAVAVLLIIARRIGWLGEGRTEGVAETIEARAIRSGRLSFRSGTASAVIAAASLGAGASAGREGPAVHLGASIASVLSRRWKLPPRAGRALLACGAAAAVSASFNAPIAGMLFALEVVLGHYALSAFAPVALASVTAAVIARTQYGDFPAFIIPPNADYSLSPLIDLPAAFVLGVACGVVAAAFMHAIKLSTEGLDKTFARLPAAIPREITPPIAGVAIGAVAIYYPQVLGVGYEAVDTALKGEMALRLLVALLGLKLILTAITLACRFGGGVFSPALYLGAMAGGAFGAILSTAWPDVFASSNFYAIVGMGAVSGAVLGAPISTTLIVFELTADYQMTIALLIAVAAAAFTSQALFGRSFFHWQLTRNGYDLSDGPQGVILKTTRVRDVMTRAPGGGGALEKDDKRLYADGQLGEALKRILESESHSLPVVEPDDRDVIIGYLTYEKALEAYNRALVEAHVEHHR